MSALYVYAHKASVACDTYRRAGMCVVSPVCNTFRHTEILLEEVYCRINTYKGVTCRMRQREEPNCDVRGSHSKDVSQSHGHMGALDLVDPPELSALTKGDQECAPSLTNHWVRAVPGEGISLDEKVFFD